MAGDGVFAGKNHGDDVDMEVAATVTGARVPGVQVRVVTNGQ
jgi:predicted naringenin-chalcone synthase